MKEPGTPVTRVVYEAAAGMAVWRSTVAKPSRPTPGRVVARVPVKPPTIPETTVVYETALVGGIAVCRRTVAVLPSPNPGMEDKGKVLV